MTAGTLKGEHHLCQVFARDLSAFPSVADCVILAEYAAKVAIAEEDRARSSPADKGPFFAKMRPPTRHKRLLPRAAVTGFPGSPVYMALPGTDRTILQDRVKLIGPLFQFTSLQQTV
jgi:hypothetical protein